MDSYGRGVENGPLEEGKLKSHRGGGCGWPVKHNGGLLRHSVGRAAGKWAM